MLQRGHQNNEGRTVLKRGENPRQTTRKEVEAKERVASGGVSLGNTRARGEVGFKTSPASERVKAERAVSSRPEGKYVYSVPYDEIQVGIFYIRRYGILRFKDYQAT